MFVRAPRQLALANAVIGVRMCTPADVPAAALARQHPAISRRMLRG